MAKRSSQKKAIGFLGPTSRQLTGMLVFLLLLGVGIITTLLAVSQQTPPPSEAAACDDSGCANVLWQKKPPIYQITNCAKYVRKCDANGDQQICTIKKFGECGGKSYCCPGPGQKWTTNLTACKGKPAYSECKPSPTPTPTLTPTSTPTPTPEPTDTPEPPTPTPSPTPRTVVYVEPATPTPTRTPTPTPTSYILNSCNKACTADTDCPGGLTCATAFGQKVCRNPLCADQFSCLCNQGAFSNLQLSPTPTESGLGGGPQVSLTVASFTDSSGNADSTPTITGLTEPGALVTISIFPDGVSGTVTADASGRWSWRSTKTLTPGQKSLLVVAKNATGAQGQVNQTFTVAAAKGGNPWGIVIVILIIIALGFGGYVYYKSNNP